MEEEVIEEEIERAFLREKLTQSKFESETIAEFEKKSKREKYPLDGRNFDIANFGIKKKRRLERSVRGARDETRGGDDNVLTVPSSLENVSPGLTTLLVESVPFQIPTSLWTTLYEFQQIGVRFLLGKYLQNTGALLADEMGLGKSIQVIAFLVTVICTYGDCLDPILIVCPTTLVSHWEREWSKWANDVVVDGESLKTGREVDHGSKNSPQVYIVSYEVLRGRITSIARKKFSVLVLDEAQRIRNPFAQTTDAAKRINALCRVALSGSPIQNNLSELWSVFDFVAPGKLGSLGAFKEELGEPIETGTRPRALLGAVKLAVKCAVILREITAPLMLRRLKTDYADQLGLAPKDEQVLFCQLSEEQVGIYCQFLSTKTVRDTVQRSRDKKSSMGRTFYCLSILRKIANHPDLLLDDPSQVDDYGAISRSGKLQVLVPLLKVWHKENRRCLIFSQSLGMLDLLEGVFRHELGFTYARMDGGTHMRERDKIVKGFETGDGENSPFALLLSTRVGGVGLNLIAADRVVIFDPDWNPMTDAQARERSWRIGQEKEVKIFRLVAADSIEEIICRRQIYKHHLAQKILVDPRQVKSSQWDHVEDFFKPPLKKITTKFASATARKIMDNFEKIDLNDDAGENDLNMLTEQDSLDLSDLITKVWNQEEIEMPALMGGFDSAEDIDRNAQRAIQAVLAESAKDSFITPVDPKRPSKKPASAMSRSQGLLGDLSNAQPVVRYESTEHVIEKTFVRDLRSFFKKESEKSTEEVLTHFAKKIPTGANEIFRACLRGLCDYTDGSWVLKPEHR